MLVHIDFKNVAHRAVTKGAFPIKKNKMFMHTLNHIKKSFFFEAARRDSGAQYRPKNGRIYDKIGRKEDNTMRSRDKKLAVLHCLSQESEPVSLKSILQKLGDEYVERSVRRWLAEMVKEGLVEKVGIKRGTQYKIIQRANRQTVTTANCFGSKSEKIIAQVRRPLYERNPVSYEDDWLDVYRPNTDFLIPLDFRLQLHKAGKRSRQEEPAGTYAHQIFNRLLKTSLKILKKWTKVVLQDSESPQTS